MAAGTWGRVADSVATLAMRNRAALIAGLLLVLASLSCRKLLPCDGQTEIPSSETPCPEGTKSSEVRFPDSRYCERPDGTPDGPFITWYMQVIHISDIPTDNGGLRGQDVGYGRGHVASAGWAREGRLHGVFVRWYQDGQKALQAVYCRGAIMKDVEVQRWSRAGSIPDADKAWLTPPPGTLSGSRPL